MGAEDEQNKDLVEHLEGQVEELKAFIHAMEMDDDFSAWQNSENQEADVEEFRKFSKESAENMDLDEI